MDDLNQVAIRLSNEVERKLENLNDEYKKTMQEIEQLNEQLQSKEMFVDRSENASFTVAMEARDRKQATARILLDRITALESDKKSYTPMGFVQVGSTVCVKIVQINADEHPHIVNRHAPKGSDETEFYFKIVPESYADAQVGLTPSTGPFARAALGHVQGDIVTAIAPRGSVHYLLKGVL